MSERPDIESFELICACSSCGDLSPREILDGVALDRCEECGSVEVTR